MSGIARSCSGYSLLGLPIGARPITGQRRALPVVVAVFRLGGGG